jgi:hypothetical protein
MKCNWSLTDDGMVRCIHCNSSYDASRDVECVGASPKGCLAGTALKSILDTLGITATPNCSCNARAAEMDARGCDWCEGNIDTVVGWLREEATKRGLPFLDAAGRLLVRRAISNARKQAKMKQ